LFDLLLFFLPIDVAEKNENAQQQAPDGCPRAGVVDRALHGTHDKCPVCFSGLGSRFPREFHGKVGIERQQVLQNGCTVYKLDRFS